MTEMSREFEIGSPIKIQQTVTDSSVSGRVSKAEGVSLDLDSNISQHHLINKTFQEEPNLKQ